MSSEHTDVDPADVVHRRGRWQPPARHADPPGSDHGCERGWLGVEPVDARPIPCRLCRPHLTTGQTSDGRPSPREDDKP